MTQLNFRLQTSDFRDIDLNRIAEKKSKPILVGLRSCRWEVWGIGLASDDVTKLSNAWQRRKLVLNKGSVPYKSMLGEKSLAGRSSLFLLTTSSQLSVSHFKRYWRSDKSGAVFRSIDDLPACLCMGLYLCFEPILPVATPVVGLWRCTCKPYNKQKRRRKEKGKKKERKKKNKKKTKKELAMLVPSKNIL